MSDARPEPDPEADPQGVEAADPQRGAPRRSWSGWRQPRWRWLAASAFLVAGVLFVTSAVDSRAGTLRTSGIVDLSTIVTDQRQDTDGLQRRVAELNKQVSALSRGVDDARVNKLQADIDAVKGPAGLEPVAGAGLTITLQDAPEDVVEQALADGDPPADALIVHQQDIQAVVNALWLGGAEAVSIQDQRIIATTGIKCAGPIVILHGVPYSPPYRIKAVGDPTDLARAIDDSEYIDAYRDVAADYGLGFDVGFSGNLEIPAYEGTLELRYAKPLGGSTT